MLYYDFCVDTVCCLYWEWPLCSVEINFVFFQAEDGIRDLVRSRGLGDVYKRQPHGLCSQVQGHQRTDTQLGRRKDALEQLHGEGAAGGNEQFHPCLLYTSDAADERSSVDLGGRRIIKKKKKQDD